MDILKTLPRQSRFKLPASARRTGVETKTLSPMPTPLCSILKGISLTHFYLLGGGWGGEPGGPLAYFVLCCFMIFEHFKTIIVCLF